MTSKRTVDVGPNQPHRAQTTKRVKFRNAPYAYLFASSTQRVSWSSVTRLARDLDTGPQKQDWRNLLGLDRKENSRVVVCNDFL